MQFQVPLSPETAITGLLALGATVLNWRFAVSVSATKLEIKSEIDSLKRELTAQFMPAPLAIEQRASLTFRIDTLEEEVKRNRESIHTMNNRFTELIMGELAQIKMQLQDKVRRMANIENKLETLDTFMHDFARQRNEERDGRRP